jgi:hypothetical protein
VTAYEQAVGAVARRYPTLTGPAFERKVRRVAAILRHSQDGPSWTAPKDKP